MRRPWLFVALLIEVVVGMLPAMLEAIACDTNTVVEADPSCSHTRTLPVFGDVYDPSMLAPSSAGPEWLFWALVAVGAIVVPILFGALTRSWWWPPLCAVVAGLSIVIGLTIGHVVPRWFYPHVYGWFGDDLSTDLLRTIHVVAYNAGWGLPYAALPAPLMALLGTGLGKLSR